MGFGGISIWSLLLILAIVVLLFGTKKLRNVGGDLGGAIRSFKKSVKDEEVTKKDAEQKAAFNTLVELGVLQESDGVNN